MIAELLEPGNVVFGLSEDFSQAIERLCDHSSLPDLAVRFRSQKVDPSNEGYSYIGQGVAIPHLHIDQLPSAELILGISAKGISFNQHKVHIVLFLATPAEQPAQHLQLLQRVSSLLPGIRQELLAQRDADRVLRVIAHARRSARPTRPLRDAETIHISHSEMSARWLLCELSPELLFTESSLCLWRT